METTDFFTAPASTRFHAAYERGLLDHSLNVYNVLISKHYNPETDNLESFTLVSLLHDLCKAGFYKTELRNRKNDHGEWERVPVYACLLYTSRWEKSVKHAHPSLDFARAVCYNKDISKSNGGIRL